MSAYYFKVMKVLKIISIKKGCSLFDFIEQYCKGEGSGHSPNRAFHRLCSLMRKMNAQSVIVEELDKNFHEIKDECNALSTYYGKEVNIEAFRFTFILDEVTSTKEVQSLDDKRFLASAIVINFEKSCDPIDANRAQGISSYLYSAFVTIPKIAGVTPLLNNYIHVYKDFNREVSLNEGKPPKIFKITGTFFAEQNTITSVCAHASLCMILNNIESDTDLIYTAEDINRIVGIKHDDHRRLSQEGLDDKDISKVLTSKGLDFILLDFFGNPNIDYDAQIYHYLESKFPCLLIFTTNRQSSHIVPILGHTLNSDIWKPEAEVVYSAESRFNGYLSAVKWVDHFIIHDDNLGVYICLPVDTLKRITLPKHDPFYRAAYAIAIVPSKVTTTPREAEWASAYIIDDILTGMIKTGNPLDGWSNRLAKGLTTIRTFNISKEAYRSSLEGEDFDGNKFSETDKDALVKDLPDRFWLSEITLPDLYAANKTKIIDFFYGCSFSDDSQDPEERKMRRRWLQIRFPFVLYKRYADGKITATQLSVKSHYPLLPHVEEPDKVEW